MSYRVLRLLEYTYPNAEAADRDMARWAVPPIGTKVFGEVAQRQVRSTVMQMSGEDEDGTAG